MLRKTLYTVVCTALLACPTFAHDYRVSDLHVDHPWARALPPVAPSGAAYLRIENRGEVPDKLIAARSPIAGQVEFHEHIHVDGLMKMQKVDQLAVSPGNSVVFEPGGYHLMMFGLKQPLVTGEHFPLTLVFEHAGNIEVDVMIHDNAPSPSGHDAPEEAMEHHH